MSRLDKQQHQEYVLGTARDTSVRLFAFANTRPCYQVVFSPEEPLIILKSKKSATPQHPCQQWEPLSSLIFQAQPNTTHAIYVADTTEMSSVPAYEQEEQVSGAAVGPLLKRLGNALTRLNPHNATMVAAGVSAHLGLKYVLVGEKTLGHRDRLVQRLLLVCPTPLSALISLTNAVAKKPIADGYPLPEVVVLLQNPTDAPEWTKWLCTVQDTQRRIASFRVVTDLTPTLFAAVAREARLGTADGTTVDVLHRYPSPRVYRIDFVLSKQTKTVIQLPRLSSLSTLGYNENEDDEDGDGRGHHHHHHHVHDHRSHSHHHHPESSSSEEDEKDTYKGPDGNHSTSEPEDHCDVAAEEEQTEAAADVGHGHHGCFRSGSHAQCHGCSSSCCGDHHHYHGHGGAGEEEEEEASGGSMLVSGLQALAHWCDPVRVLVEGRVLDLKTGLIGTTDGCVVVSNLAKLAEEDPMLASFLSRTTFPPTATKAKAQKPPAVAIAAVLNRDDAGRTTLLAEEARPLTRAEIKQSMTAGSSLEEIPVQYNISRIAHSYGALLIRGRKCALVRDVDQAHQQHRSYMSIPWAPHSSSEESAIECAVRALCDGCEVSSDNFYIPSYLPPVVYYCDDKGGDDEEGGSSTSARKVKRCVTIYTALAVSPPPRGPTSDAVEDAPEPEEPYDWVSFGRALTLVETEEEREVLREAQRHLANAHKAGLHVSFGGCGVFGEEVKPLPGAAATAIIANSSAKAAAINAITTTSTTAAAARLTSLAGIELYVVACPGDAAQELVPMLRQALHTNSVLVCGADTTTTAIEDAATEAQANGDANLLLYLTDEEDAETFCEKHLLDLTEERQATAQVFTLLLPQVAKSILALTDTTAEAAANAETQLEALLSAARVSDALVTLVPPKQMSSEEWAVLRACSRANPDLSLVYSWEARQSFTLESEGSATASSSLRTTDASAGKDDAASLRELKVSLPAGVPIAPAALAYLTHAGALDCFFAVGECRLLLAQGDVWIPTRGATQGFVYLDVTSHCLAVEPGEEWEQKTDAARTSELTLLVWCASAAAAAEAVAQVNAITRQLQWDEKRDGSNWTSAYDPLPKWE